MTRRTRPIVAIDGPAGAGKSTVSRRLAETLGYLLLDTGALYRCVGLVASRRGVLEHTREIGEVAQDLARRGAIQFTGVDPEGVSQVSLDGEDVSRAIRTSEAGQWASRVSAIGAVREALLEMQRAAGAAGGVVVEGRDIGTVVFPDAEAKFFLTASVGERARRRYEQLGGNRGPMSLGEIEQDVAQRDRRDSSRAVAPLTQADDAVLVDSTGVTLEDVVAAMAERVRMVASRMAPNTP